MGRKLFVFTKKESISSYATNFMLNTWYDVTKELKEGHDDVYTTQILALAGAQDLFEEIYVDNEIIWPNERQHITNKELRPAHNLAKLVGCWYRYIKEGKPL